MLRKSITGGDDGGAGDGGAGDGVDDDICSSKQLLARWLQTCHLMLAD